MVKVINFQSGSEMRGRQEITSGIRTLNNWTQNLHCWNRASHQYAQNRPPAVTRLLIYKIR